MIEHDIKMQYGAPAKLKLEVIGGGDHPSVEDVGERGRADSNVACRTAPQKRDCELHISPGHKLMSRTVLDEGLNLSILERDDRRRGAHGRPRVQPGSVSRRLRPIATL